MAQHGRIAFITSKLPTNRTDTLTQVNMGKKLTRRGRFPAAAIPRWASGCWAAGRCWDWRRTAGGDLLALCGTAQCPESTLARVSQSVQSGTADNTVLFNFNSQHKHSPLHVDIDNINSFVSDSIDPPPPPTHTRLWLWKIICGLHLHIFKAAVRNAPAQSEEVLLFCCCCIISTPAAKKNKQKRSYRSQFGFNDRNDDGFRPAMVPAMTWWGKWARMKILDIPTATSNTA